MRHSVAAKSVLNIKANISSRAERLIMLRRSAVQATQPDAEVTSTAHSAPSTARTFEIQQPLPPDPNHLGAMVQSTLTNILSVAPISAAVEHERIKAAKAAMADVISRLCDEFARAPQEAPVVSTKAGEIAFIDKEVATVQQELRAAQLKMLEIESEKIVATEALEEIRGYIQDIEDEIHENEMMRFEEDAKTNELCRLLDLGDDMSESGLDTSQEDLSGPLMSFIKSNRGDDDDTSDVLDSLSQMITGDAGAGLPRRASAQFDLAIELQDQIETAQVEEAHQLEAVEAWKMKLASLKEHCEYCRTRLGTLTAKKQELEESMNEDDTVTVETEARQSQNVDERKTEAVLAIHKLVDEICTINKQASVGALSSLGAAHARMTSSIQVIRSDLSKFKQSIGHILQDGREQMLADVQALPVLAKNKVQESKEGMLKRLYQQMAELQLSWEQLVTLSTQGYATSLANTCKCIREQLQKDGESSVVHLDTTDLRNIMLLNDWLEIETHRRSRSFGTLIDQLSKVVDVLCSFGLEFVSNSKHKRALEIMQKNPLPLFSPENPDLKAIVQDLHKAKVTLILKLESRWQGLRIATSERQQFWTHAKNLGADKNLLLSEVPEDVVRRCEMDADMLAIIHREVTRLDEMFELRQPLLEKLYSIEELELRIEQAKELEPSVYRARLTKVAPSKQLQELYQEFLKQLESLAGDVRSWEETHMTQFTILGELASSVITSKLDMVPKSNKSGRGSASNPRLRRSQSQAANITRAKSVNRVTRKPSPETRNLSRTWHQKQPTVRPKIPNFGLQSSDGSSEAVATPSPTTLPKGIRGSVGESAVKATDTRVHSAHKKMLQRFSQGSLPLELSQSPSARTASNLSPALITPPGNGPQQETPKSDPTARTSLKQMFSRVQDILAEDSEQTSRTRVGADDKAKADSDDSDSDTPSDLNSLVPPPRPPAVSRARVLPKTAPSSNRENHENSTNTKAVTHEQQSQASEAMEVRRFSHVVVPEDSDEEEQTPGKDAAKVVESDDEDNDALWLHGIQQLANKNGAIS